MIRVIKFEDDRYESKEGNLSSYTKSMEREEIINVVYYNDKIVLFYWEAR